MAYPVVSDVLDEARNVYLNDAPATLFTNTVLLPFVRKAYRDLQAELVDNGISVPREKTSAITIPAGTTSMDFSSSPALPDDLLYPIILDEKQVGQADDMYVRMTEMEWEPDIAQAQYLRFWTWREGELKFVGATGDISLRIKYFKQLAAIVDEDSDIPIIDSDGYIAARVAALAAATIGKNYDLASAINEEAEHEKELFLGTSVKNRQAIFVRPRPFRAFRNWGRW